MTPQQSAITPGSATTDLGPADHSALELAMFEYDRMDSKRIQHFVKVRALARTIAMAEGVDARTAYVLEAAAIVHDAGIHESERLYGNASGKHQEELGPGVARPMLERLGYSPAVVDRVCWLIAHHHTYGDIQGTDYQILVEADFLVNIYEDAPDDPAARERMARSALRRIFRTATGSRMLELQYLPGESATSTSE
ncbi:MAG: HD domain-containing protein [Atopobiaceae bacterium]